MTTKDAQILSNWFSPNFPTGGFSYSSGFDNLMDEGVVFDAQSLQAALSESLASGQLRNDGIFMILAFQSSDVLSLVATFTAFSAASERFEEADAMGRAFVRTVNELHDLALPDLPYPIAVGAAVRKMGLNIEMALPLFLQTTISNISMIASRLIPLGATQTQRVISNLSLQIFKQYPIILRCDIDDISSGCFMMDMASMKHETQEVRLCKT